MGGKPLIGVIRVYLHIPLASPPASGEQVKGTRNSQPLESSEPIFNVLLPCFAITLSSTKNRPIGIERIIVGQLSIPRGTWW